MMLGMMLVLLPLALTNTFAAYLLWGWSGLFAINYYLYGFMASVKFVFIFAIIALVLIFKDKNLYRNRFKFDTTTILFSLLAIHGLISASLAYSGLVRNWELYLDLLKTMLFCICMSLLVTNRLRMHALVIILVLSTSFHGLVDGLKFLASGGSHNAVGMPKFGDNNHIAMVMVMILPLAFYLYRYTKRRIVALGFLGLLATTVLAVVATGSRGGLISMLTLSAWLVVTGKRKMAGIFVIVLCSVMVVSLAPESWTSRMNTIKTAEEDSSFLGRVGAWKVSSAIALSNPFFGGGFRSIQGIEVWNRFKDSQGFLGFIDTPPVMGVHGGGKAAHSIYFEVVADLGFLGLLIYLSILLNAFVVGSKIKRFIRNKGDDYAWAYDLANMLMGSMLVYMVGGALLSAAYFELPYICTMLLAVLFRLVSIQESKPDGVAQLPASNMR